MAYADYNDLLNKYPELEKVGGSVEVTSSRVFAAEREIDSMLSGSFTTPFSTNNYTATDLTVDYVYLTYMITKKPKLVEGKMDLFMKRIESLNDGKSAMIDTAGVSLGFANAFQGGAIGSNNSQYDPTFDMDRIENSRVDKDLIDDIEDSKL